MRDMLRFHQDWRHDFIVAMMQGGRLDAERIANVDLCALGIWLQGPGRQYAGQPWYEQLVIEHAFFHREAAHLARQLNQGRYQAVEDGLQVQAEYNRRSQAMQQLFQEGIKHVPEWAPHVDAGL